MAENMLSIKSEKILRLTAENKELLSSIGDLSSKVSTLEKQLTGAQDEIRKLKQSTVPTLVPCSAPPITPVISVTRVLGRKLLVDSDHDSFGTPPPTDLPRPLVTSSKIKSPIEITSEKNDAINSLKARNSELSSEVGRLTMTVKIRPGKLTDCIKQ